MHIEFVLSGIPHKVSRVTGRYVGKADIWHHLRGTALPTLIGSCYRKGLNIRASMVGLTGIQQYGEETNINASILSLLSL